MKTFHEVFPESVARTIKLTDRLIYQPPSRLASRLLVCEHRYVVYNLVFAALVAVWISSRSSGSLNIACLTVCTCLLFFFIGFREQVGCDWTGYQNIYQQTFGADFKEAGEIVEPAYAAMFVIIHAAGLNFEAINIFSAATFVTGLYAFCRRQPDPMAALATFFPIAIIHLAMSGIRQASGLAILMLAFNAYLDRRRVLYCAFVIFASLFHRSAIVFLLYAFCIGRRLPPWLSIVISMAAASGVGLVGSLGFEEYQSRYIDTEVAANGGPVRVGLVAVAALAFIWNARLWRTASPKDFDWLSLMSGAMIACFPLSILYPVVGDRFGYYLIPAQVTIFNRLPYLKSPRSPDLVLAVFPFVLLGGFQVLWLLTSQLAQQCYTPYHWWLFDWLT